MDDLENVSFFDILFPKQTEKRRKTERNKLKIKTEIKQEVLSSKVWQKQIW